MMHYEAISPVLGHALTGAVLAIFALGVIFWLLLAFRVARAVAWKHATLEGLFLANATTNAEAAPQMKGSAP